MDLGADDFGDFAADDASAAEWLQASFDELCWRIEDRATELLDADPTVPVRDALADAAAEAPDHDERDVQEAVRVVTADANLSARASLTATGAVVKAPPTAPLIYRRRGRDCRVATNTRTRGSRRTTSRSAGGGSGGSDDDGESEPPRLRLWRHPRWGACNPGLLRVLIGAGL